MSTLVLASAGMHCGSCGMLIDEAVEDLPGYWGGSPRSPRSKGAAVIGYSVP